MLFAQIMNKKKIYVYSTLLVLVFLAWVLINVTSTRDSFNEERIKIALRAAGNQLLLSNRDATSLILPIRKQDARTYLISFEKDLSFEPYTLVTIIDQALIKSKLPKNYLVEVVQCADQEVAYSYQMSWEKENTIVSCAGRNVPNSCYSIKVVFLKKEVSFLNTGIWITILGSIILVFLIDVFVNRSRRSTLKRTAPAYTTIGRFRFYPEQNKLVKEAEEIALSRKECELLEIFVAHPNEVIKRDTLTKKVWEDHGVIVGRSLDTYVSKLRKILKDDESIKLSNVHGVGYKLIVN